MAQLKGNPWKFQQPLLFADHFVHYLSVRFVLILLRDLSTGLFLELEVHLLFIVLIIQNVTINI